MKRTKAEKILLILFVALAVLYLFYLIPFRLTFCKLFGKNTHGIEGTNIFGTEVAHEDDRMYDESTETWVSQWNWNYDTTVFDRVGLVSGSAFAVLYLYLFLKTKENKKRYLRILLVYSLILLMVCHLPVGLTVNRLLKQRPQICGVKNIFSEKVVAEHEAGLAYEFDYPHITVSAVIIAMIALITLVRLIRVRKQEKKQLGVQPETDVEKKTKDIV